MVSTSETGEAVTNGVPNTTIGVPPGRYRLVAWDVDTSGKRLIDEICQIAAYTPSSTFAQYVMPFADLNLRARRRHNIRVVTVGRYRLLKDSKTNKVLKTKSDIYALTDFLTWLEETKGDAADGIILIFHEQRKVAPAMLLESLQRFNLLDRFLSVVKGFVNSYDLAENKCAKTVKVCSLKLLSRVLLDKEPELDNAVERARLTYQIVQHLSQSERQDLVTEGSGDCTGATNHMVELVREYTQPIANELNDLARLKKLLECQKTLRPVFEAFLRSTRTDRLFANRLRQLLAENNMDYLQLEAIWKEGARDGLNGSLKEKQLKVTEEDFEELLKILDCHFDPEKEPMRPKQLPPRGRNHRKSSNSVSSAKNVEQTNAKTATTNGADHPDNSDTVSKEESSSENTGNPYSDAGSAISSDNTPRSQTDEAVPVQ